MKYLITTHDDEQASIIKESNCEILAEYKSSVLARCDVKVVEDLKAEGLEVNEVSTPAVKLAGRSFAIVDAAAVDEKASDPSRKHYYIAQLIGPSIGAWLEIFKDHDAEVIGSLQSDTIILKMLPSKLTAIKQLGWIEGISTYHPLLKLSAQLLPVEERIIGPAEFSAPLSLGNGDPSLTVEITIFPGEKIDPILETIRGAEDTIISNSDETVKAIVKRSTIENLANQVEVQVVQPFTFPTFQNDVARVVMNVPHENIFSIGEFDGQGQIVAVCDSGLDTGDTATVHPDIRGRINDIRSFPTQFAPDVALYINGPVVTDDGAKDDNSGHGTHVVGSVAGDGTAAHESDSEVVPLGVAPAAQIYFQAVEQRVNWKPVSQLIAEGVPVPNNWPPREVGFYGIPDDLRELFSEAYDAGARVHTNSWGANESGRYNDNSRKVDQSMSAFRDLLVIFAAGNDGKDVNSDSQIDLDSMGAPGTAKNCLTVGASENDRPGSSIPEPGANTTWDRFRFPRFAQMVAAGHVSDNTNGMACFSSRGPTDGGRTKPEIVAPGTNILSLRSTLVGVDPLWGDVTPTTDPLHGNYCWSGGTSMSTPLVAGLAALMRQCLIERHGHYEDGVRPSGALIKACLLNGVTFIGGQFVGEVPNGANNITGFGRVSAASIIDEIGFDDEPGSAVETGEIRSFDVEVIDTNQPLRVTLCWTDPPSLGSVGELQNRLYLQLVAPNGDISDGDITPFPTVTNNSQQIEVKNPTVGTYTIRVRGVAVTQQAGGAALSVNPQQDFALVYCNAQKSVPPSS